MPDSSSRKGDARYSGSSRFGIPKTCVASSMPLRQFSMLRKGAWKSSGGSSNNNKKEEKTPFQTRIELEQYAVGLEARPLIGCW